MNERNPDRDWPIMNARQAVVNAEKELERKPSPFNALDLQDKRQRWETLSRLTLV